MNTEERNKNIENETPTIDTSIIGLDNELTAEMVEIAKKISKRDLKEVALGEMKYEDLDLLMRTREEVQRSRIRMGNHLSAYRNMYGDIPPEKEYLTTAFNDAVVREYNINKMIEATVTGNEVAEWLMQNKGFAHITVAKLMSEFKLVTTDKNGKPRVRQYASEWISYAGLNKHNRPWIGVAGATSLVEKICGKRGTITQEMVLEVAAESQWKFMDLYNAAYDVDKAKYDRSKLINAVAKRPYNGTAQALLYNAIVTQIKLSAKKGADLNEYFYAKLYYERLALEMKYNEQGKFAEQAIRESQKYKKAEMRELYESGKLSTAHLQMRAMRYAEKILLSHLFEETYRVYGDGAVPAEPYAIAYLGHKDWIEPLYPYTRGPRERTTSFVPSEY